MSRLNETVKKSAEDHKPSYICRYLLDLCKLFNEYYHNNKILQDDKELEKARIHLIKQIQTILGIGMNLIGMQPIEEM